MQIHQYHLLSREFHILFLTQHQPAAAVELFHSFPLHRSRYISDPPAYGKHIRQV